MNTTTTWDMWPSTTKLSSLFARHAIIGGKRSERWNPNWIDAPLRWRKPCHIELIRDIFHPNVPADVIDRIFAVMALCQQHVFVVLTKRPERMQNWFSFITCQHGVNREILSLTHDWTDRSAVVGVLDGPWPLRNVALGVTAEDQKRADERIPHLLATPAACRFVSYEPALGPVDWPQLAPGAIDGVIMGGESGPGARPMHPDWVRDTRDKCAAAGVRFFFKQWGEWAPVTIEEDEHGDLGAAVPMAGCSEFAVHKDEQECLFWQADRLVHWPLIQTTAAIGARRVGKTRAGRVLDGRTHNELPWAKMLEDQQ